MSWKYNPEKIRVIVFASGDDLQKYFNLFNVLLKDGIITAKNSKTQKLIETDKVVIDFAPPLESVRGKKCHYIINLTRDEDFHHNVALPTTIMYSQIDKEGKWSELFDGI